MSSLAAEIPEAKIAFSKGTVENLKSHTFVKYEGLKKAILSFPFRSLPNFASTRGIFLNLNLAANSFIHEFFSVHSRVAAVLE